MGSGRFSAPVLTHFFVKNVPPNRHTIEKGVLIYSPFNRTAFSIAYHAVLEHAMSPDILKSSSKSPSKIRKFAEFSTVSSKARFRILVDQYISLANVGIHPSS